METSLRYSKDRKQLCLHAKESFVIDRSFFLKAHGRLNTHTGSAAGVIQLRRRFFPQLITSFDLGAKYDTDGKEFSYDVQAKKTLPITVNGLLSVDVKGGYNFNPLSKIGKPRGVIELNYKIFSFTEEQDVRLRVGYDPFERKPYLQVRENNWSFNSDFDGNWNVVYDL